MSEHTIARLRELLEERAELQKQQIDLEVEITLCQKAMDLQAVTNRVVGQETTESAEFIEANRDNLDLEDREFLGKPYRSTKEVTEHTGIPRTSLGRLADEGRIQRQIGRNGYHSWSTVSVMEFMIGESAAAT